MFRRHIERLGPYQSLALLAIPTSIVEPLKLAAVAIVGTGHWVAGSITILSAYAASLFLVERLFTIVKPKLLTLSWFAKLWIWFVVCRGRVLAWLISKPSSEDIFDLLKCKSHPALDFKRSRRMPRCEVELAERQ